VSILVAGCIGKGFRESRLFFSVEGGPRSGKGLIETLLAAWAHCCGLRVYHNLGPTGLWFPPLSFGCEAPEPLRSQLKADFPEGFVPKYLPLDAIVDRNGLLLFKEKDCFHLRQEFYTEIESRSMGNKDVRFGVLDWIMQLGKDRSSLTGDCQDLDSLDKRFRVGGVSERLWAMRPFHERGEDFVYGIYDRPTLFGHVRRISEADVEWLYPYYETLHKSARGTITRR